MRWVVAPLVAALMFLGSGWLDALERTTKQSAELARSSASAPAETRAAAASVASLPRIASLTGQQADAFRALVDALDISAERVENLNRSIEEQGSSLDTMRVELTRFQDPMRCVRRRLERIVGAAENIPPALADIQATIAELSRQQERSLRHLKSINRKMTALGVVASASDVEPPPPPGDAAPPEAGAPRPGDPC